MIGPGLARDPLKSVEAISRIIAVGMVFTLGAVATATILIHCSVAAPHDLAPAPQNCAEQGSARIGEPALCGVCDVLALRRGDAVRDAVQNHREARPALLRQINKGIQPDTVAHRHHRLKTSGTINRLHHLIFASRGLLLKGRRYLISPDSTGQSIRRSMAGYRFSGLSLLGLESLHIRPCIRNASGLHP